MDYNGWLEENYNNLRQTTLNIIKNEDDVDDLLHCVLEQLLRNKSMNEMGDKDRLYYFIRTLKNNYFSKTSKYHYQFRKPLLNQITFNEVYYEKIPDEEYQDRPTMVWVHEHLSELSWFDRDLFLLWVELGSLTAVSKRTTIPLNSVGRYIKQTKDRLNELWENRN